MTQENRLSELYHALVDIRRRYGGDWIGTGSVALYGHGNDLDIVGYCPELYIHTLLEDGWELCGGGYENAEMRPFRKGEVNLLLCHTSEHFEKWRLATQVGTMLNGFRIRLDKEQRGTLFSLICDQ